MTGPPNQADDLIPANGLEFITVPPRTNHTATVIWLHGLGDDSRGMLPYALDLARKPEFRHIKWILPDAERMSVTGNGGRFMRSWFDCYNFDIPNRDEDEEGLFKIVGKINDIITTEERVHHIPSNRIIVGGLSQGSAVSILLGLTTTRPLAGIFVLSGYIPLRKKAKEISSSVALTLPIFWGHGEEDLQVDYQFSIGAAKTLTVDLGIPFHEFDHHNRFTEPLGDGAGLIFNSYADLGHWLNETELDDLGLWIGALIA